MVRAACTNIAVRTTVMIGSLVLLLLMALLPGPVGWLVGSQRDGPSEGKATAGMVVEPRGMAGSPAEVPAAKANVLPSEVPSEPLAASVEPGLSGADASAADTEAATVATSPAAAAPTSPAAATSASPAARAPAAAPPVDRCWYITSRLREWGAAYYRLESWQDDPQVFRFQCTLPTNVAGESGEGAYRTFEAVGADPTGAMERVLADVRAWRDGDRF